VTVTVKMASLMMTLTINAPTVLIERLDETPKPPG
jgi:hypothetical protein